ncbi:thioredoxin domain-containing protein [Flavobacterium sp. N1736]|uniref:thioredoxin domain-containing protein n=1 Tax=Flavobacterium sp. N1736 TaxID=2986823 RepID=UPI0022257C4F|nr:thioredoxin domain-containing protein [Flavobacterium sp. N1736]
MNEDLNYLFQYLEKEGITIDKTEFLYQIKSHPDYPSLLSIADTLSFFSIDNQAIQVDSTEIELLPDLFIALLKKDHGHQHLYLVEQKDETYFLFEEGKNVVVSKADLIDKWRGIVLLIEKSESVVIKSKRSFGWILPSLCLLLFLAELVVLKADLKTKLFFGFPIMGFLFSMAALKDLFETKSELINKFCNISTSTSCTTVVSSDKWAIFKLINFSDLSVVFFVSQFIGLFSFLLAGDSAEFFNIQIMLLFASVPVTLLSLYFQKFVEKKWCPICLVIVTLILAELSYLLVTGTVSFSVSVNSILLFGLLFLVVANSWFVLKKILVTQKKLKEFKLKANRFLRNYQIFKNSLLSKEKVELPFTHIVLGNRESNVQITILTNPFCGHCKDAHEVIERILEKYGKTVQIKIIFKTDLEQENEERKLFFRTLMGIYIENGEEIFKHALNDWFHHKNIENWLEKYQLETINTKKIDATFNLQNNWCKTNDFNFTPEIFVNGYVFPEAYERENLELYITELTEDKNF